MTSQMGNKIVAREIISLGYGNNNLVHSELLFHLFASKSATTNRHSCTNTFLKTELIFSLEMPDSAYFF